MVKPIATLDQYLGKAAKLLRLLREAGLSEEALQWPIDDPDMRNWLVQSWLFRGYSPTPDHKRAREIMGTNFLGVEDVIKYFDILFTIDEASALRDIPFTKSVLQECKDTHILFPGYPMTILDIQNKSRKLFYCCDCAWYNGMNFAKKEKVGLRWYLIHKDIIQNSTNKMYEEQIALLSDTEEAPRACEMFYMIILYYLVYQKRLFKNFFGRCVDIFLAKVVADLNLPANVGVGCFNSDGLSVGYWITDDGRQNHVGLAASQKVLKLED